jgi:tRNA U34 5-methylaminomethyl-2-thiouridine-forming methyltransferase MnmC
MPAATPPPHAVLFDPYSPKKNPMMWTVSLFANLFRRLDPQRPCTLANYTRSTMARVALLLGGFSVGVGHPSGLKEETTVAANRLELLDEPLDRRWLERAARSHSAEPLQEPAYLQAPLLSETLERLRRHPQFG